MLKNFEKVLHTILIVSCIVHVLFICIQMFYPSLPEIRVYKKDLKDIEFPISFRICAHELRKGDEKFKKLGYKGIKDFFRGRSMFNKSLVGWTGHTENGSTIGTVDGLQFYTHPNFS